MGRNIRLVQRAYRPIRRIVPHSPMQKHGSQYDCSNAKARNAVLLDDIYAITYPVIHWLGDERKGNRRKKQILQVVKPAVEQTSHQKKHDKRHTQPRYAAFA